DLGREDADRLGVIHILLEHHEADGVPALAAAETLESLSLRSDDERRSFLFVKGAKPLVACAGAFERDISGDDFLYVHRSLDFQDCFVSDQRHTPLPRGQRRIPTDLPMSR